MTTKVALHPLLPGGYSWFFKAEILKLCFYGILMFYELEQGVFH